jgi:hypothetical protein
MLPTSTARRSSRPRRLVASGIAAFLAAILAGGLVAVPAHAADPDPQPLTWSVQPSTAKGLDERPNLSYTLAPGTTEVDYVAVSNFSEQPLTLDLYATDADTTPEGDFGLLPAAEEPTDAGSWITLKKDRVRVPARSRTTVPFSMTVPDDATPGDHVGGVVASLTTGADGGDAGRVAIEQRAGTRLYVRVLGELTTELALEDVQTTYDVSTNPFASGVAEVRYTVRNTGNVRMSARRSVELAGPFGLGKRTVEADEIGELPPGSTAEYIQRFEGVLPAGRVTGTVTLTPYPLGVEQAEAGAPIEASAGSWALSWPLALALLVLVLLGYAIVRGTSALRVRRDAARAAALESARAEGRAEAANATTGQGDPTS